MAFFQIYEFAFYLRNYYFIVLYYYCATFDLANPIFFVFCHWNKWDPPKRKKGNIDIFIEIWSYEWSPAHEKQNFGKENIQYEIIDNCSGVRLRGLCSQEPYKS